MSEGIRSQERCRLTLIRHGESLGNLEGRFGGHSATPLTELGHRQAASAAEALVAEPPEILVASDLRRAVQSAEPVAERFGLPLHQSPSLRERGVGVLDGALIADAATDHPEQWKGLLSRDPDFVPEGGESLRSAFARIEQGLRDLVDAHPGKHLVLVSHAIAINMAIHALLPLGGPAGRSMAVFRIQNSSLTSFELGRKRVQMSYLNRIDHLPRDRAAQAG